MQLASQPDRGSGSIGLDTPELAARFDAECDEDLFRWYWTVRALRNNRVPISGLHRPSRAIRAIEASCAVSGLAAHYLYESVTDKDAFVVAMFGAVAADIAATTQAAMAEAPRDDQS